MLFSTQLTYLVVAKISQVKFVAQTLINSDILFYNSKRKAYFSKEKHISTRRNIISNLMKSGVPVFSIDRVLMMMMMMMMMMNLF